MLRLVLQAALLPALFFPSTAFAQVNIAPSGTASQSSNWASGVAGRAIDGNRDPHWFGNSIQHTDNELDSWWQVDFSGKAFAMTEIRLYPRTDCCTNRNSNMHVSVWSGGSEIWGTDLYPLSGELNPAGEIISLPPGMTGDLVRVQFNGFNLQGNGYMHLAEVEIEGSMAMGTNYCGPAVPNSSGLSAEITAVGSDVLGEPFGLVASGLPPLQFGIFLVGSGNGTVMPPASTGNLCIVGGSIGRFNLSNQIQFSNTNGSAFGLVLDPTQLPLNPTTSAMVGETWNFQGWFRDGMGSSNMTDAVAVTFQ